MTPREHAISLFNKAQPIIATDPSMAYQMLASAIVVDPGFALGWAFMGATLADIGTLVASCEAYRAALRLPDGDGPGDMTPALRHRCLLQLGHRLTNQKIITWDRLWEAEDALHRALDMEGEFDVQETAFCHTNLALTSGHRGDEVAEMAEAEAGFRTFPDPATELGLAFACLYQGEYIRGLKHFEARFPYAMGSYLSYPAPRWDGGHVETLYVLSEQGLGDALSLSRFIPLAAARVGRVVFPVQPPLTKLIGAALRHVSNVSIVPQDRVIEHADAWCPVSSLPLALGQTDAEFRDTPGLPFAVDPVEDTSWKRRDARLHVAVAWAGAPGNGIDAQRSIPMLEFLVLRAVPGIALYSVQVGERGGELHAQGATGMVRDMTPWIHTAYDTAGLLGEMDAVVCCESFVGHLAGALGKRCYLMVSRFGRDWRSSVSIGNRVLWYPRHTAVRQGDDLCWAPAFGRVVEELSR